MRPEGSGKRRELGGTEKRYRRKETEWKMTSGDGGGKKNIKNHAWEREVLGVYY